MASIFHASHLNFRLTQGGAGNNTRHRPMKEAD
jgi:hypothetical protein